MKKLILIPTIAITAALVFSFALPGVASTAIRAIAPAAAVQTSNANAINARSITQHQARVAAPAGSTGNVARPVSTDVGSTSTGATSNSPFATSGLDTHSVATGPPANCGRYGGGFHGGKHLMVCPNRPFPAPVITHLP